MKVAKYTHKSFDGIKIIKGWVLVNNYGVKRNLFITTERNYASTLPAIGRDS